MEPGTLRLFILTYEGNFEGEEVITKQLPIYDTTKERAEAIALDWLLEHEKYTYLSVREAPKEGVTIDGIYYITSEEVSRNGC